MYKYLVINHIPRCGGSSLRKSFHDAAKNNNHFNKYPVYISSHTHNNICLHEDPYLIKSIHPDTLLFMDHSPSFFIEQSFNLDISLTYRAITIRNPVSRIISHIHFFYQNHIDTLPKVVLESYLSKYGNLTINYLTNINSSDESLKKKYSIAKKNLQEYNFIFKVEEQKLMEKFNSDNPFELHLSNHHLNKSPIDRNLHVSSKTKNIIYKHINYEIKLLENYYEMDI